VLDGLKGESSWSGHAPVAASTRSVRQSREYGLVLLAFAIVGIIVGLIGLYFVSRIAPKGTVLAIAVAIWVLGALLRGSASREMAMVSGSLSMLGVAGGILGLMDVFRKRKLSKLAHDVPTASPDSGPEPH
jgi:hypothetical protein